MKKGLGLMEEGRIKLRKIEGRIELRKDWVGWRKDWVGWMKDWVG